MCYIASIDMKQRCSHRKRDGRPCKAWAMPNTAPPVCASHGGRGVGAPRGNQNRRTHGLYRHDPDEGAELDPAARVFSLQNEIDLTRVVLRRLLWATPSESWEVLPLAVKLRVHGCVNTGVRTVARLVRTEQRIKRMKLTQGEAVFQNSTEFLNEAMRRRQSFYLPGKSLGDMLDAAGEFSLIDEIARRRYRLDDAMGYWQEREPDVKEMVALANTVFRGVNQVRRLVEDQLALLDNMAIELFNTIIQTADEDGSS